MTDPVALFGQMDIYLLDQLLRGRIRPGMAVLDAGAGHGRNLAYFLRERYEVLALDSAPQAIAAVRHLARQLAPHLPAASFRAEAVEASSFPDHCADVVISSAVLHFARDEKHFQSMLDGSWRLLRPGGMLFCRLASTIDRAHQLAKSGLDEARRAIGMLRDDDLPGPDKLAALAWSFEADSGIPCRYVETGQSVEVRPAVKLALYRVAQEGLTNIRKHAHPERVEVRLEYLRDGVSLAVEDFTGSQDEPAPAAAIEASGGGYGLTGMRERAELLGGTLTAGPTGCGFRVVLRVPA